MKNIVIIAVAHCTTGGDLMKIGKGMKVLMQSLVIALKSGLCLTSPGNINLTLLCVMAMWSLPNLIIL